MTTPTPIVKRRSVRATAQPPLAQPPLQRHDSGGRPLASANWTAPELTSELMARACVLRVRARQWGWDSAAK